MCTNYSSVTLNISDILDRDLFFSTSVEKGRLIVSPEKPSSYQRVFENILRLSEYVKTELQSKDIRQLSFGEKQSYRELVDVVSRAAKCYSKKFGSEAKGNAKVLLDSSLQLKLGGKVSIELLNRSEYADFKKIISANHLHNSMEAIGYQMDLIPSIEVEGVEGVIDFTSITHRNERSQDAVVNAFYLGERLLFKTDENFVFLDEYAFINGKICLYNRWDDENLKPYDIDKSSKQCKIELWTALLDKKGDRPPIGSGDHTFCALVSEKGERYGLGKLGCGILGHHQGYIESPDRYLLLPTDTHNFKKTEFHISKESFDKVLSSIQEDRKSSVRFDMFDNNCTSYIVDILSRAGIKIDYKIHIMEILFRKILPRSFVDATKARLKALPSILQKFIFFLPFVYIPTFIAGIGMSLLNWKAFSLKSKQFNFFNVVFFPWKVKTDNPFAIREWQKSHQQVININDNERNI